MVYLSAQFADYSLAIVSRNSTAGYHFFTFAGFFWSLAGVDAFAMVCEGTGAG
jgi:hypothetical protein